MVYIILLFAIMIIVLNVRAIKKDKNSFQGTLLHTSQDMSEFDIKLGKVRNEFSETILELQKEIESLKNRFDKDNTLEIISDEKDDEYQNINNFVKNSHNNEDKIEYMDYNSINNEKNQISNEKNDAKSVKINEIEKLLNSGLSMDEISEKLGIGKGEVLLIKELYLK